MIELKGKKFTMESNSFLSNKLYTEIILLDEMLQAAGVPHTMILRRDGAQIFYPDAVNTICDAIEFTGSYGASENLLELMGLLTPEELEEDTVCGYLSALEVFGRILKHYMELLKKKNSEGSGVKKEENNSTFEDEDEDEEMTITIEFEDEPEPETETEFKSEFNFEASTNNRVLINDLKNNQILVAPYSIGDEIIFGRTTTIKAIVHGIQYFLDTWFVLTDRGVFPASDCSLCGSKWKGI